MTPSSTAWERTSSAKPTRTALNHFGQCSKRGYIGTCHQMNPKHLGRYAGELAGRHNARPLDTVDQMAVLARGMVGKRLRYRELIA